MKGKSNFPLFSSLAFANRRKVYQNKWVSYLLVSILTLILYLGWSVASFNHLLFFLKPTSWLVQLLSGETAQVIPEQGFRFSSYSMIIGRSCSGINFMVICSGLLLLMVVRKFTSFKTQLLLFPLALIISWIATILVNTARILISVAAQVYGNFFLEDRPHYFIHQLVGIACYLFFLILIYLLTSFILNKLNPHAKPA